MFENLPPKWRPSLELPVETRATCSACLMTAHEWPPDARDPGPFKSDLKCCTYEPFVPNFSLGRVLLENPMVRLTGRLTPLGLLAGEPSKDFGRELRCQFLEGGRCSIWQNRPSVCRSYFCVSVNQGLWREAETLGNAAEWEVSHEMLWSLGFTQDEIAAHTWAEWKGRERELYVETARRAFGV